MKERQPMNFVEKHSAELSIAVTGLMVLILGYMAVAEESETLEMCVTKNAITRERISMFNEFKPGLTYDLYPQCRGLLELRELAASGMPIGGW